MHARLLTWSLRHRRWRHVVNALIMAITVAVVMLFVSVTSELLAVARVARNHELARILVWPKVSLPGSDNGLPVSMYSLLKEIPGVKVVTRNKGFSGRDDSGATYLIVAEEDAGIELTTDFFPIDPPVLAAWRKDKLGAIVSEETVEELKLKIGELAELPTPHGPLQIKVVGVSRGGLIGHRIAVHYEYIREFIKGGQDTCGYRVYAAPDDYERIAKEIIEKTKHTATPAQAFSDSQYASSWVRRVSLVPALLGFLGAFLMFTTALTLANNTAIAIRERRIETATLRTLGFRKRVIVRVLLSESIVVGFLGGLLAVAVTALVVRDGIQLTPGADRLLQKVALSPFAIACGLATSIVIPLAGALPAAFAAVRRPLVDALRDSA